MGQRQKTKKQISPNADKLLSLSVYLGELTFWYLCTSRILKTLEKCILNERKDVTNKNAKFHQIPALNRGLLYLLSAAVCVSIYPLYCEGECLMKGNTLAKHQRQKVWHLYWVYKPPFCWCSSADHNHKIQPAEEFPLVHVSGEVSPQYVHCTCNRSLITRTKPPLSINMPHFHMLIH